MAVLQQKTILIVDDDSMSRKLPEMGGIETLEKIRADKSIAETKVIFLTANDFSRYEDVSKRLGVLDFISKPMYGPETLERIRKTFAKEDANTKDTVQQGNRPPCRKIHRVSRRNLF